MIQRKTDIVDAVMENAGLNRTDANAAVKAVLGFIQDSLEDGDSVQITGFGTFSVKERPERKCRNPQTGDEMTIPAKNVVRFKPGKLLSDAV